MPDFGLNSQRKNTRTWGGSDGISGGGHKYDQLKPNTQFKIINNKINKKNIHTDKPYDGHITQ